MGPNGRGKSTLSYVLAGRDGYDATEGRYLSTARTCSTWLRKSAPAKASSWPSSIRLKSRCHKHELSSDGRECGPRASRRAQLDAMDFLKYIGKGGRAERSDDMLKRAVNTGFSGGEKKRMEILQMAMLEPKLAILDETDSGLDIDALKVVADGVNALRDRIAVTGHHPLSATAGIHRAGPCACARQGPDREIRRQGAGARAGKKRLCRIP